MARILKIESDSSFQLSQVLEGTFLTYKTYQNGRIIVKAKLPNGNVVEMNPSADLNDYYTKLQIDAFISRNLIYKTISSTTTALDGDFLICTEDLTVNLPSRTQGAMIGISIGATDRIVNIIASLGDRIYINDSDSNEQGFRLGLKYSTILLIGTANKWHVAIAELSLKNINNLSTYILQSLLSYYTQGLINDFLNGISDSMRSLKRELETELHSNYYTKSTLDPRFSKLSNSIAAVKDSLQSYYIKEEVDDIADILSNSIQALKGLLHSNYYTKGVIDGIVHMFSNSISGIRDLILNYYNKDLVDRRIGSAIDILSDSIVLLRYDLGQLEDDLHSNYYTTEQIDQKLRELSNSLSLQNYYTKDLIDRMLLELSNSFSISLTNYYTKLEVDGFVSLLSDSIQALRTSIRVSYYTSSQTSGMLSRLEGFIADKIDKPSSTVSNGYVLMKTAGGTSWGSVSAGGPPFISSNYYTKSDVDQILSDSYYTRFLINAISSGLNAAVQSRMYNPVNAGTVGNILIKTASGTSWGGSVYTGDTFSSANYYTSDLIDGMITTLSDSLHTKLTAPTGGNLGDVIIKTANGPSWGSVAGGGEQTWTSLTVPSTGALVITPTNGYLQRFSMTRNLILSAPTLTTAVNSITLQVLKHATSSYVLSKGALAISINEDILLTWYYDGVSTRELPIIYLGK